MPHQRTHSSTLLSPPPDKAKFLVSILDSVRNQLAKDSVTIGNAILGAISRDITTDTTVRCTRTCKIVLNVLDLQDCVDVEAREGIERTRDYLRTLCTRLDPESSSRHIPEAELHDYQPPKENPSAPREGPNGLLLSSKQFLVQLPELSEVVLFLQQECEHEVKEEWLDHSPASYSEAFAYQRSLDITFPFKIKHIVFDDGNSALLAVYHLAAPGEGKFVGDLCCLLLFCKLDNQADQRKNQSRVRSINMPSSLNKYKKK